MKIVDYVVLFQQSPVMMDQAVKNRIKDGWQPQGGVACAENGWFAQAMVKYAEEVTFSVGPPA